MLIAFDLDGVLIDSEQNMRLSWDRTRQKFGLSRDIWSFEHYFALIGRPFKTILRMMEIDRQFLTEPIEQHYFETSRQNQHLIQPYPHVDEVLCRLKDLGHKLCVVTSKSESSALTILNRLSLLDSLGLVVSPDSFGVQGMAGKPAPDHLLHVMRHYQVSPDQTLYVGDMATDQSCAQQAGVPFAFASWGYGQVDQSTDPAPYVLQSMVGLLGLVTGLLSNREITP